MPYIDIQISFSFTEQQKGKLVFVLNKFPEYYACIHEIKESLKIPGEVVLMRCQALILAGVVDEYFPEAAQQIRRHPAMTGGQRVGR